MSTKNKAAFNSPWKIGGELSSAAPLNTAEMAQLEKAFEIAESARDSFYRGFKQISRADAKRNQSAAQAVSAFLCDRFAEQYSHEDVVEAVAVSSSVLVPLTTQLENQQDYLVGGTLWLLDYLKAHCKSTQDYVSLLPEADESLDCAMPFVADLDHPISVITQIMTVLQGRKKKYHKVLGSLLALIDDATAAKLRQFFMTSFLEYMDRSMKVHSRLKALGQDSPRCEADTLPKQGTCPGLLPELPRTEKYLALVMGPQFICRPVAEIEKRLQSKKASELLSGYSTTDPYALCAAYLLLEYEQDALANLGSLTAAVVSCGTNHLPWTRVTLFTESFIAEELFDSALPDHTLQYEYQERHPLHDETPFKTKLASEEQIFFNATNVMMPRHRRPSQQLIQFFVTQGIPEPRAQELAWAAMFAYYTDAGPHDLELSEYENADVEDAAECALEANQQETPYDGQLLDKQEAEIKALTQEVKELRSALHDAEQKANEAKEELHAAELTSETDRSELAQLRETLYNLRSGEAPDVEEDSPSVELPWPVQRRIAVFGGHDSWRKVMKPLLPGARFYDRELLTDLNIVRSSDVVWLQVNSMAHSHYNRIIDTARTNGIPVRYFGSASPKKCAMQLALDEMEAEKRRSGS